MQDAAITHALMRARVGLCALAFLTAAMLAVPAAADARKRDKDRDGLADRFEVRKTNTNPRKADTDRDGLTDGFEYKRSKTKPRRFDTDRDGMGDGLELLMARDPLKREKKDRGAVGTRDPVPAPLEPPLPLPLPDPPPLPDILAPETTVTAGPTGTVAMGSASFDFTSSEADSTFECRLDNGPWGACASPKAYSGLANGSHTFNVRASDAAGNTDATPASRTWTVNVPPPDTTPPNTTITAGPSDPSTSASASFSFTSSETGSTFQCRLDAGTWGSCTSPKAYSNLANGSHTFEVRARDAAGNTDGSPATRTWTVAVPPPQPDTTAPDTTISSGPSGTSTSSSASFGFTSSETGSTFECRMDAGAWGSCSSPKAYSNLANGSHTFDVRATDAAGNVDLTPATRTWTVAVPPPDTTPPDTTISSGPSGTVTTGSASLAFTSSETGSTFQCRLDAGAWGSCSSPKSYSNLANGSHTFDVRATDGAGNTDATPASRTWTVDVPAPPPGSAQVYLSPTGSDTAACTQAAPCRTMTRGYNVAASGNVIQMAPGVYPGQDVPAGTKAVTFKGGSGVVVRQLISDGSNATFDGVEVDAGGVKTTWAALELHGDNQTFKNARVGNVVDEKGLLVTGDNHTINNVEFHDAVLRTEGIHMECVYAIGVDGFTIRNSSFRNCAVMDLFFTYGSWWTPQPPSYGHVTVENNVFEHSMMDNATGWHYYSLYINFIGPNGTADPMNGWVIRNNTFEQTAAVTPDSGSNGTRWVNNVGDWDCTPGIAYSHNVGKKCGGTDKQVTPASSTQTTTAPFGWVNPGAHDFHLTSGSPAVNAGDPADFTATDKDGRPRTGTPEAGAYEF
jgi:hypothetical protein